MAYCDCFDCSPFRLQFFSNELSSVVADGKRLLRKSRLTSNRTGGADFDAKGLMAMEMWPREPFDERARTEAEAALQTVLQRGLHPRDDQLKEIYDFWSKKYRWTVEEAAALIIEANPNIFEAYEFFPPEDRERFDVAVDLLRRRFPSEVSPAELREYAPTIGIVNSWLWAAIDFYQSTKKKTVRKSAETMKDKTRGKIIFGYGLNSGYRSAGNNHASATMKHTLDKVGISIDEDTIRNILKELARDPDLANVEAEFWKDK
jgi:hypothetical protein